MIGWLSAAAGQQAAGQQAAGQQAAEVSRPGAFGFWDPHRRPDPPTIKPTRQLRFLTEDDYPPFNFTGTSGVLEGFNVDLARAVCAELKLVCTIQARRWSTIVAALEAEEGDVVLASLAITPAARQRLRFTAPYFRMAARFVARKDAVPASLDAAALAGKRVAVAGGTAHEAYLRAFFPGVSVVAEAGDAAGRAALQAGEADLLFGDGVALAAWLNGTASQGCCAFAGGPYLESHYFGEGIAMAVRPSDEPLRRALDYALYRLWERGIYADLVRRWFPVDPIGLGR